MHARTRARTHARTDARTDGRTDSRAHARTAVGRAHSTRACCQTFGTDVVCVCVHVSRAVCVFVRTYVIASSCACVRRRVPTFGATSSVLCVW